MKLYVIAATDEDDENYDLVVQASDIDRAVEFWREFYDFERENEDDRWNEDTILYAPDHTGPKFNNLAAQVFRIDAYVGVEGPVCWGGFTEIVPETEYPAGRTTIVAYIPYN